ncbi:MAG TPA: ATP-binding protein [candidate division Zixibacteria bacterium]|nr:ATP-binding protein [candidate division Zixibacteria bacterium]
MAATINKDSSKVISQRLLILLILLVAVVLAAMAFLSIRESREDSLQLLRMQGAAFTEALAQASDAAIASEARIDQLTQLRYSEILRPLVSEETFRPTDRILTRMALQHDLLGVFGFDSTGQIMAEGVVRGLFSGPPEFVITEARNLLANPEEQFALLLDEDTPDGRPRHYYLEIAADLQHVFGLAADADSYVDMMEEGQIGYLAQNMAREAGVEYIIYQSTEGIIFASRRPGNLLSIESDPFLTAALDADSIQHRIYEFQGHEVLESVRPFASAQYPFGLLRVGWSLEGYRNVSRGFDRLMISLAVVLFGLSLTAMLLLNSRRRRREISRQYSEIKTISYRLFDQMNTGVAAVDRQGMVILSNQAFNGIMGQTDTVGHRWDDIFSDHRLQYQHLTETPGPLHENELILTDNQGQERTLLVAVSNLISETSDHVALVATVNDVTEMKRFERDAARRERLSEMGNLAAGVAHEIRNPLNTISIAAQRLKAEFQPTEAGDEFRTITDQIRSETRRLNDIITRFLALAREDRKRSKPLALKPFLTEIISFLSSEAARLSIDITLVCDDEVEVAADPDAMRQIMINLFNNTKEALAGEPGKVEIEVATNAKHVEIIFHDSGPGIPPELRDKVLTPYFTTKDAGTGLGLPTVHKLVQQLGGELSIKSSHLGGVSVIIRLPSVSPAI